MDTAAIPPDLVPAISSKPARVWSIALAAALFAALVAWGVEEASLYYYGPQMMAKTAPREYRPELRGLQPGEPGGPPPGGAPMPTGGGRRGSPYGGSRAANAYRQEFTAKAIALSGGAVGGMFGLALGLALGLARGTSIKHWATGVIAGILGAAACGFAGWRITQSLVPIFYLATAEKPGSLIVILSLLLIRGVPRMIAGMAGGLALGVAAGGGRRRMIVGALGGMIGAAIGVALVVIGDEFIALVSSQAEIAKTPILRSPLRRVIAILAVAVPSASAAAWSILNLSKRDGKVPPNDIAVG